MWFPGTKARAPRPRMHGQHYVPTDYETSVFAFIAAAPHFVMIVGLQKR